MFLEMFGFKRRMPPTFEYKVYPETRRVNKYLKYQVKRLKRLAINEPEKFWRVAMLQIRYSTAFRFSALNTILNRWYRESHLTVLFQVNRKVKRLLKEDSNKLEFKRTYIPKYKGEEQVGWRPLGVPKPEWRVILHMYQNMLQIFLKTRITNRQHGFQPGKGTLTAWKDLLNKIHNYKYVYEIDLKQCFPSIRMDFILSELKLAGMPKFAQEKFRNLCLSTPTNLPMKDPKEEKIDESSIHQKREAIDRYPESKSPDLFTAMKKSMAFGKYQNEWYVGTSYDTPRDEKLRRANVTTPLLEQIKAELLGPQNFSPKGPGPGGGMGNLLMPTVMGSIIDAGIREEEEYSKTVSSNLPQGSPISPLLTIYGLNQFVNQCEDSVFYADDGIFLSNKRINIEDNPHVGAFIHKGKSSYIVENGKIWKECKFLGLTYNLETRELRASTRKGATIGLKLEVFKLLTFLKKYEGKWFDWINKTSEIMKTGFSGYLIAALYNNKYDLSNHTEDIKLHPFSWVATYSNNLKQNWSTNSSKACRWALRHL